MSHVLTAMDRKEMTETACGSTPFCAVDFKNQQSEHWAAPRHNMVFPTFGSVMQHRMGHNDLA